MDNEKEPNEETTPTSKEEGIMGTGKEPKEETTSTSTASGGVHSKGLQLWVYGVLTLNGCWYFSHSWWVIL